MHSIPNTGIACILQSCLIPVLVPMDDGFYLDDKAIKHGYNSFRPNSTWILSGAMGNSTKEISATVAENAFPLSAKSVVDRVPKGAEWVLIGEASHGTREFYDMRAGKQCLLACAHRESNISPVTCHLLSTYLPCRDHQTADPAAWLQRCGSRSRHAASQRII